MRGLEIDKIAGNDVNRQIFCRNDSAKMGSMFSDNLFGSPPPQKKGNIHSNEKFIQYVRRHLN